MPRVVHFEIPADDPERAVRFYSAVFSWQVEKWPGPTDYWLITTGSKDKPGIDGAILRRIGESKVVDTIDVPSVDEFIDKIKANGGEIAQPKMSVPGVGYVAYFQDTEGNIFGIIESDMSAK